MDFFFMVAPILFLLFLLSLFFTRSICLFSIKKNILDVPNQRSSHQMPTPRGGGLAFVSVFYGAILLLWLNHCIQTPIFLSLLGGIPVACIGYCDDVFGVKAQWRASVQVLSAICGIYFLGDITVLFCIVEIFITVWFINLYNFMDGTDGLAGMEAVFVSGAAGYFLLLNGVYSIAFICLSLTFSVLGFLIWNWSPAKIFMGDVGSGFLGFIFADLMWITHTHHQLPLSVWWILLGVFIADASYTLLHRMVLKKKWWTAHREHAYQRLVQSGISHKHITLAVLCINVVFCFPLADIYLNAQTDIDIALCFMMFSLSLVAWFFINRKYKIE